MTQPNTPEPNKSLPKTMPTLRSVPIGIMLLAMWQRPLRLLVLVLVGLAYLGGTTVQALPPSSMAEFAKASTPMPGCTEMAGMAQDTGVPVHKGITPDCVKLMHCLGILDLPVQARLIVAPVPTPRSPIGRRTVA